MVSESINTSYLWISARGMNQNHTEEGISLSHTSYLVWLAKEISLFDGDLP